MAKRQIQNEKYDIEQLVSESLAEVNSGDFNKWGVIRGLERLGITEPTDEQTAEYAFLDTMGRKTGARFQGQFGRGLIDTSSHEAAVQTVNAYLNRRVSGMRSNWRR